MAPIATLALSSHKGFFLGAPWISRRCRAVLLPGGALPLFTDGLTDSTPGENPEDRLHDVLANGSAKGITALQLLVGPKFNEDDVTILLVTRDAP